MTIAAAKVWRRPAVSFGAMRSSLAETVTRVQWTKRRPPPKAATMRRFATLFLLTASLGACGVDDSQLVQTDLINQPAQRLHACFGAPAKRERVGVEQVWIYNIGKLRAQGWVAALGLDEHQTFSAPTPDCQARFTIDSHGIRGVAYTDASGHALPQAEVCDIRARACLGGR